MADCIFCKIIEGQIPTKKVYEDDDLIAFDDINPVAPTHILLIPKKHIDTLNEMKEEDARLLGNLMLCARKLARERKLSKEGYRLVMNCMPGAGQSVYHVHFHMLGGRVFHWPPG